MRIYERLFHPQLYKLTKSCYPANLTKSNDLATVYSSRFLGSNFLGEVPKLLFFVCVL